MSQQDDQPQLFPYFSSYQTSPLGQYSNIPYHRSILQTEEAISGHHHHMLMQKVDDGNHHFPSEGSSESSLLDHHHKEDGISSTTASNKQFESLKRDDDDDCGERNREEARWMSSKMRLMRKMVNSYPSLQLVQRQEAAGSEISSSSICSSTTPVRVCSDCSTTKTPLWRSGPHGPKSLCNACGIRQRKARKAMAAAASLDGNMNGDDIRKMKKVSASGGCNDGTVTPYKKRFKLGETRKKIDDKLEDFGSIRCLKENNKTTGNCYPLQDEKEAAILLMALSCGLING